ncbi:hypothetical protein BGX31_003564 [Mortierella sp. GBA43]|nr:hypothetical protein BGX31_003564 [Mortierella sp. GBA43]
MTRPDGFMGFADMTPQVRFLWMSPSTYDILGYEPEEFLGRPAYEFVCPDDQADLHEFLVEYFAHDLIASQYVVRFIAKDGRRVPCAFLGCNCYDFSVGIFKVLDSETVPQRRAHSATMNRIVGSKKEVSERMKRHHQAFAENSWDRQAMEPEARVCLIINRFTRSLTIMYASSACEKVLQVDPDEITGKPILLYIRSDDLAPFVEQVDLVKATTTVSQMRFWFQSPNARHAIPCEAVVAGTPDGIAAVIRRCKPFVRKHLIGSTEMYEFSSRGSSESSGWSRSYSSTPLTEPSPSPPVHTYGGYGPSTPSPPRNMPWETLNRIRIFELDDEKPLRQTALAFQEVIAQDYYEVEDDDDVDTVVRGVAISRLDDDNMRD